MFKRKWTFHPDQLINHVSWPGWKRIVLKEMESKAHLNFAKITHN